MSNGWRRGEAHPRATLPDELVRFLRALRERHGWPYTRMAAYANAHWRTVADIVNYRTRMSAGTPTRDDIARAAYAHGEFRSYRLMFHVERHPQRIGTHN